MYKTVRRLQTIFSTHHSLFFPKIIPKHYHASIYPEDPTMPAWIIHDENGTALQITTDKLIGPHPYFINRDRSPVIHRTYSLLSMNMPRNQIIIGTPSIIYDSSLSPRMEEAIYPWILYAIPQSIWEKFILTLDNQEIVHLLNLKQHRHLWPAVNFSSEAASKDIQFKRAGLIGSYHFLLYITINKAAFSYYSEQHSQEEKKEAYITQITENLDNGIFVPEHLEKLFPCLTKNFLKKVAHCANFEDIIKIAKLVSTHAEPTRKQADLRQKFDAINWLPSSKSMPKEFSHTLKFAKILQCSETPDKTCAGFFFTSRKQWSNENELQKSANSVTSGVAFSDYFEALFNDLILRQLWQQSPKKNTTSSALIEILKGKFKILLAYSDSIIQLDSLQNRWHKNIISIEASKPPAPGTSSWKPIIRNMVLGDIAINVLTSETALKAHGKEMMHCVGGYVTNCLLNKTNILELIDGSGTKSTLELTYQGQNVFIRQHRGLYNSKPKTCHVNAAEKLMAMIDNGTIKLNLERVDETPHTFSLTPVLYPYDIENLTVQESIYQAYKRTESLPKILSATNYQDMLNKADIINIITEVLEMEHGSLMRP